MRDGSRMDHDASWSRLFGHPFVAADLIRLALPDMAQLLDFATLKPLHTRWVRVRPLEPSVRAGPEDRPDEDSVARVRAAGTYALRTGDQAWRVWRAGESGRSLIVPVEYQSTPDARMGVRSLEYGLLAHEMEWRHDPDADNWLRVLPLVVFSGALRWAREDPPWAVRRVPVAGGWPWLPLQAAAVLLDAASHGSDDLHPTNVVASLLSLNVAPDANALERGLDGIAEVLWKSLPAERTRRLIDDLMDWVAVCQPGVTSSMLESTRRKLKREEEPTVMALARMGIEYPRRLRAEGRAAGLAEGRAQGLDEGRAQGLDEGRAQGLDEGRAQAREEWLVHERGLLLRQTTRKFDAETAARLEPFLAAMEDAARFADVGDWIIDCITADELLARVSRAGNGR